MDTDTRIDPRASRSADALRDAILTLAAERPIESITVNDVAAAAGLTRKTVYNHAESPLALLSRTLTAELDEVRARMDLALESEEPDLAALSRARLREIVAHVQRRRAIYRQSDGRIHPVLYRLLSDHFFAAIRHSIAISARRIRSEQLDEDSHLMDVYVGFVAHAYAGAIETWLRNSRATSIDELLDAVIESLPPWMTTPPSVRGVSQ